MSSSTNARRDENTRPAHSSTSTCNLQGPSSSISSSNILRSSNVYNGTRQLKYSCPALYSLYKEESQNISDCAPEATTSSYHYTNDFGPYVLDAETESPDEENTMYYHQKHQQEMELWALAAKRINLLPRPFPDSESLTRSVFAESTELEASGSIIPKTIRALRPDTIWRSSGNSISFGKRNWAHGRSRESVLMLDCLRKTADLDRPKDLVLQYLPSSDGLFTFEIFWPGHPTETHTFSISTSRVMTKSHLAYMIAREYERIGDRIGCLASGLRAIHPQVEQDEVYFCNLGMTEMRQCRDEIWRAEVFA